MEEKQAFKYFNYSVFIHFLGRSLYSIFVPILLIKNGYSVEQAILFLALVWSTAFLGFVVSTQVLRFSHLFYFNLLASLVEIGLIILLFIQSISITIFTLLFLFEGLYYAFYYVGYNGTFIQKNLGDNTLKNFANLQIAAKLSSLVAPLVGAGLLFLGRQFLLLAAGIFVLLSIIPLIRALGSDSVTNNKDRIKFSFNVLVVLLYSGLIGSLEINLFSLWSIFSFVQGYSIFFISFIPISSGIISILLLNYLKEKMSTQKAELFSIVIGAILIIAVSLWRIYFPEFLVVSNLAASLGFLLLSLPALTKLYGIFSQKNIYHSLLLTEGTSTIFFAITAFLVWINSLSFALYLPLIIAPILLLLAPFLVKSTQQNILI